MRMYRLLTGEVNAAIRAAKESGADVIYVNDSHGPGAINVKLLDSRVQILRGWPPGPWPLGLDSSFDAIAWVGQHTKVGTVNSHLAHTQGFSYLDLSINGISIGEFGQLAMCASELGVRAIFAAGEQALALEAKNSCRALKQQRSSAASIPGLVNRLPRNHI